MILTPICKPEWQNRPTSKLVAPQKRLEPQGMPRFDVRTSSQPWQGLDFYSNSRAERSIETSRLVGGIVRIHSTGPVRSQNFISGQRSFERDHPVERLEKDWEGVQKLKHLESTSVIPDKQKSARMSFPDQSIASANTRDGTRTAKTSSAILYPESGRKHQDLEAEGKPIRQALIEEYDDEGENTDDEDDGNDDNMLDDDGPTEDGLQAEANNRTDHRKMRRFRLTHQQTRFLMSEFAKQAHPDAAHRERLSKEIPGLSPRQVQVWFQNRRAKIKRLTVDDRERMMKMRAVPEGFDNVQALHSPYGAVASQGTAIRPSIDYAQSYSEPNMIRPRMVDTVRRQENTDNSSASGLNPGFNQTGFTTLGPIDTADIHSPHNKILDNRYLSGQLSQVVSVDTQGNFFHAQNCAEDYQSSRPPFRQMQPLQLQDTMARSRSGSLQSPLKTSISWKDGALAYSEGSLSGRSLAGTGYTSSDFLESLTQTSFPPSLPSSSTSISPVGTGAASFPSSADFGGQYRILPSQNSDMSNKYTRRTTTFASAFSSGGFQSAPLLPPAEYQVPRTPIDVNSRGYHMVQSSPTVINQRGYLAGSQTADGTYVLANENFIPEQDSSGNNMDSQR